MYKTVKATLPSGCRVLRMLLQRFGAKSICQMLEVGPGVFRVRLRDGRLVAATVLENGTLDVQELEETA